jgi:hypothetical protein
MVTLEGGGESITLDATPSESHTHNFDATEHPVEVGANIVDHIRPKAREVKLDGILVDAPIGEDYVPGRSKDGYATLERLASSGTLFTVFTEQIRYENMVITILSQTRDRTNADAVKLSVSLREIRTVKTQSVLVVRRPAKTKTKEDDGTKTGKEPKRSGLKQIFDAKGKDDLGTQLKDGIAGVSKAFAGGGH